MNGFGSTRTLRNLNVAAVGLALAACTAAIFARSLQIPGLATGPTTLVAGVAWALCMRSRRTVGRSKLRKGWVWSIPIAIANAGVSCGIYAEMDSGSFVGGLIMGMTVGMVVWMPALFCTLACFGPPIAWSQAAAERGLAGEERGEAVVGFMCLVLSAVGLALALAPPETPEWWNEVRRGAWGGGLLFARVSAALGLVTSATATSLALVRESRRSTFVRRVDAGAVPGFRVDDTTEGRVLMRVTELGSGYRVTNFTEELYALDEAGRATRAPTQRGVA